jgi:polar amino acid transport system substrate-binding protein
MVVFSFFLPERAKFLGRLLALICLLVLAPCPAFAAEQKPMRVDYPDFWPFFSQDDAGQMTGFFYEIVSEALGRMGVETIWRAYPWSRCQTNVRGGEADAMITVPTAERLAYSRTHSDPFFSKQLVVFTCADHPRIREIKTITGLDDIRDGGFSVITYMGNGWNEENINSRGIKSYETPNLKGVWLMLAQMRGDIAIEWPGGAWPDIRAVGAERDVVQTGVVLESMPFHLLVGNNSPYAGRLAEFNEVILSMQRDRTIERIVGRYAREEDWRRQ